MTLIFGSAIAALLSVSSIGLLGLLSALLLAYQICRVSSVDNLTTKFWFLRLRLQSRILCNKGIIFFLELVYAMPCIPYLTPCHHKRAQEENAQTYGNKCVHIHLRPNAQDMPRKGARP